MKRTPFRPGSLWMAPALCVVAAVLSAGASAPRAQAAAVWYVAPAGNDSHACNTPGSACATVGGALTRAAGGDTILLAVGTYTGTANPIVFADRDVVLSGGWNNSFTAAVGRSTIDGQNARQGLIITTSVAVSATRLIIENGATAADMTAGNITNYGTLVLSDSTVAGGRGTNNGAGGLANQGVLTVTDSTILNNLGVCGGLLSMGGAGAWLERSVVYGNQANVQIIGGGNGGGGLCALQAYDGTPGRVQIDHSSILFNSSLSDGGGLFVSYSWMTVTNSTLTQNMSYFHGGGLALYFGGATVNNTTITDNQSGSGAGLSNTYADPGAFVVRNSILIVGPSGSGSDCSGAITSGGYNLLDQGCFVSAGSGDQVKADARLGALTVDGSDLSQTPAYYPLLDGSPAINAGNPTGCRDEAGQLLAADQRGVPRVGRCDVGAIEAGWLMTQTVSGDYQPGRAVTYVVRLNSPHGVLDSATLTDSLPAALTYISGTLQASSGSVLAAGNTLSWTGTISAGTSISYGAIINGPAAGLDITNTATLAWHGYATRASAGFHSLYHLQTPLLMNNYCNPFFADDFSYPSGWAVGEDSDLKADYLNGEYQVLSKQPFLFLFRAPACARPSYDLEADMRWEGAPGSDIGLLFGLSSDYSQYYFADIITDYQAFGLFRHNPDGSFTTLGVARTNLVHPGSQSNHLTVIRDNGQITLGINGQGVGAWVDTAYLGNTFAGLAMAPYSDRLVADARFDNVKLTTLGANTARPNLPPAPDAGARLAPLAWQPGTNQLVPRFGTLP